ncbi:hypothetical protein [Sphaerisporangium aureirubrum]|uniref:Uncharacterized protein n=1 Tax=Sphaerisporangium aureirubrum TaxID=1544736 RepID=A0ABW1NLC3_9ACTN
MLRVLVERADRLGLSDDASLKARVTMRGRVRSMLIEESAPGAGLGERS